jgi:hypothetical protein
MAGSKRWFSYQLDDGTTAGIFLDESNTEAVNGGAANPPAVTSRPTRNIPAGTKARSVFYQSVDGNRVIKITVLNPTIYNGIPANLATIPDPLGTGTLAFLRKRPEIVRSPNFGVDTGINDGDTPN